MIDVEAEMANYDARHAGDERKQLGDSVSAFDYCTLMENADSYYNFESDVYSLGVSKMDSLLNSEAAK